MGRAPYEKPKKRFARELIKAVKEGKLEKNVEYKINKFHEVTDTHAKTIRGHLVGDITREEIKEKGEEPGVLEINVELTKQGSPLQLRKTIIREVGGILYGCEYGPLGIARRPLLDRQIVWRKIRPTPFLDLIEWRLNRPGIL